VSLIDDEFSLMLSEHLNQKWEVYDPTNKDQCVDAVIGWNEYLGIEPKTFGVQNAYQIYTSPNENTKKNFEIIKNSLLGVPKKGDIVVWSNQYGPAGHTAIATGKGNVLNFEVFSQNDPLGSPCVLKTYSYSKVLGWLRPNIPNVIKYNVRQLTSMLEEAVKEKRWE